MTVASQATVSVGTDASSPSYAVTAGGTTGVTVGVVKFRPSNEAVNLQKVGLTLTNGSYTGVSGATDVFRAYIYSGSTLLGSAVFAGNATTATSTFSSSFTLPKDVDTLLTIKADLNDVGTNQPGVEGDLVKIDVANYEGSGASSGSTVRGGSTTGLSTVSGVRLFNTFPTIAQDTLSSSAGSASAGKLIRFKVTADSHGNVGIYKFVFNVATSSNVTIANLNLYGYTDSSYSTPISGQQSGGQIGSSVTNPAGTVAFNVSDGTKPVQVPAGSTYYFELRGSVASGSGTGNSLTTTLLGDSSEYTGGVAATSTVNGNFIWSPNATTTAITTANVNLPTGTIYGDKTFVVQANGQLMRASAYGPTIIAYRNGRPVRLEEVAHVFDGVENDKTASWQNDDRCIFLTVRKQPGTNVVEVVDGVKALIPAIQEQLPPSVSVAYRSDRSGPIRESVRDVKLTLLATVALVIFVIFSIFGIFGIFGVNIFFS